eukprot:6210019-Pleurochrysis_carterae.AAC.1
MRSSESLLSESLELAKEAVRCDARSSRAWATLGNAQLSAHGRAPADEQAECLHLANKAFLQERGRLRCSTLGLQHLSPP